jgi:2-(1,2-epoxy-1,2-dihydrophenyl)acetyl-CoA isomerase
MTQVTATKTLTFDCSITDDIACVHLRSGAFLLGTDLGEKQRLKNLLRELESADEVKAVLLLNTDDAFTASKHRNYVETLAQLKTNHSSNRANILLEREDNALDQYALLAIGYRKLLVSCLVGEISTPFFGLSLTSDIRIAEEGMHFSLSHVELGVPPIGGLGYLLPKYIGQGRAAELLITGGKIDDKASRQIGLVNKIIPHASFEEDCIKWVRNILRFGTHHIHYTRQLLYRDCNTFEAYLRKESKIRLHAFNSNHANLPFR